MTSRPITLSTGYDEKVDEMERKAMAEDSEGKKGLDKSEIVVKKERFEELLKKEQMFDEMCKVIEAGGAMPKRRRLSGSISGNQKKGEGEGDNVEVVEKEKVVAKDIQEVKKGDTMCEVCEIEYPSSQALKGQVMKCHEGKYRYVCSICEKGYMVKESLTRHLAEHSGDKKVIKCPIGGCKSTFGLEKTKRRHIKIYHSTDSDKLKFVCEHCGDKFISKDNRKQHVVRCKKNPDKKSFRCDICGMGIFLYPKN